MLGCIDRAGRDWLEGWAYDPAFPDQPVCLLITANGDLLERVVANRHRPDVARAGIGDGRCGFALPLRPPLLPARSWTIRICSELDGEDLPGSPLRIPASIGFDAQAQEAFASAITDVSAEAEIEQRVGFVAALWDQLLQKRADRRSGDDRTRMQPRPRRALVIDNHGVPEAGRDGGSTALLSHMWSLRRLGFHVTFAAGQMLGGPAASALRQAGFEACHAPWFGSVEEVLRREADSYDLVYMHRVATATDYAGLVRRHQPRAWLIYSVADLHHLRLTRQAAVEQRPDLLEEARRIRDRELAAAREADAVITHSATEERLLRDAIPGLRVHAMPWSVACSPVRAGFAERSGAAFIGSYLHQPNISAAHCLLDEIRPAVHARDNGIGFRLVGADLPPELARPRPGLTATGHVADLQDVFNAVRLTVAPLRYGAGLKAKVVESLAAGVPCVCFPAAAEGFDFPPGLRDLVVPDVAAAAGLIVRLHGDEDYNLGIARLGLDHVRAHFSEATLDRAMRAAVDRAAAVPPGWTTVAAGSGMPPGPVRENA